MLAAGGRSARRAVLRGRADAAADRTPTTHGLTGPAERAALAGGSLDRGPTAAGWRGALTLPLTDIAEAGR